MNPKFIRLFTVAAVVVGTGTITYAQQSGSTAQIFDRGKYEYETHCAVCHGSTGAGDGPYSKLLTKTIPDLTTLSKTNGGVFPFVRMYEIIDGRQAALAHGTKEMPIWGPRYTSEAGERLYDDYRADPEVFVRARILALIEYIYRLQAK